MDEYTYRRLLFSSTFIALLGFLVLVVTFWDAEIIFWNYSPFKVQNFINPVPQYASTQLSSLENQLTIMLRGIQLGVIIFVIGTLGIILTSNQLQLLNNKVKAFIIGATSLITLIGIWLYTSINLSVSGADYQIPNTPGSLITPTNWVSTSLASMHNNFTLTGLLLSLGFSLITILLILVFFGKGMVDALTSNHKKVIIAFLSLILVSILFNVFIVIISFSTSIYETLIIIFLGIVLLVGITAFFSDRDKSEEEDYSANTIDSNKSSDSKIRTPITQYITFYSVMIGYLIITLIPVIITFLVSFSTPANLFRFQKVGNKDLLPSPPGKIAEFLSSTILNYSTVLFVSDALSGSSFTRSLVISLFLGFGTSIIGLGMSLTSAYALSRFRFSGRGKLIFSLVVIQMFPGIILLIPQYIMWNALGLLNNDVRILGVLLALSVGAISYSTWMMKGYFDTLPKDLEEASLIDGANVFETFMKIALPLAKPGMVAVFLFTFLGAWNDFILVRTFIGENQPDSTLSLLFYKYQDSSRPDVPVVFGLVGAYSIIMALPVCIVFIILQKYLAAGATAGAIK